MSGDHTSMLINQQIIWRNEFAPDRPALEQPPLQAGVYEVTRAECVGGKIHIWWAPVPVVPGEPGWKP